MITINRNKLFFIHVPKTGGCFVNYYTQKYFCKQNKYKFLNSYPKHNREWTGEELLSFINFKKTLVHNHYIEEDIFNEYKKKNWTFFSFFRNPKEILCSSYFYNKKTDPTFDYEINDFLQFKSKENFFVNFWERIDFLMEFSEANFIYFVNKVLNSKYSGDFSIINSSLNKGYFYYLLNGTIDKKTDRAIEQSDFFKTYLKMKSFNF